MQIPDADDECVHKLPWSIFVSLEEHSIFQKTCQDGTSHNTKRKEKLNDSLFTNSCLHYHNRNIVCKEEYRNRTYFPLSAPVVTNFQLTCFEWPRCLTVNTFPNAPPPR